MKRALLIAYHFPPVGFSSGVQRSLKFAQYLPEFGWLPSVLTVNPRAYEIVNDRQLDEVPASVSVNRAYALDTARHLAIGGRYLKIMALPDRWVSWCLSGVVSGLNIIRKSQPTVIWSTYPIATAHLIGLLLHQITGIPWVADFRDSMTEDNYPTDKRKRKIFQWLERATIRHCERAVFTTPGAIEMYQERYQLVPQFRWKLIPNGFDEKNFIRAEERVTPLQTKNPGNAGQTVLLHSGVIYPSERDPRAFFSAVAKLKERQQINANTLRIVLRSTGHDDYIRNLINTKNIDDIVFLEPGISYEAALTEMLAVDGLIIFQAENCNHQIPAKVYEYLRAKRPIVAFTDLGGDTANLLRQLGVDTIFPLNDKDKITHGLYSFIQKAIGDNAAIAQTNDILRFSRCAATEQLAEVFDSI